LTRRRLAFLTDCLEDEFQSALLRALVRAVREHDLDLISVQGGILENPQHVAKHFVHGLISPANSDALLISAHTMSHFASPPVLEDFVASFAPLPRISLGLRFAGVPSLLVDNEGGMRTVVGHLIETHSMRRIAFVGGPERNPEAQIRFRGYRRVLEEHGLPAEPALHVRGNFGRASGVRAVSALLDERGIRIGRLDAIACANDEMAVGVMEALQERGLRVPQDVAVVGFDGIETFRHRRTPLTTARQPIVDQMRFAARRLAEAIDGTRLTADVTTFPVELVIGRSCGCSCRPFAATLAQTPTAGRAATTEPARDPVAEIMIELTDVPAETLEPGRKDWRRRLATAFVNEGLGEAPDAFFSTVEELLFELLELGGTIATMQNALMTLRRWALNRELPGSPRATRADAVCHHALLVAGDVAQVPLAVRYREQMKRMLELSAITGELMAVPDPVDMNLGLRQLTALGIASSVVSLFPETTTDLQELEVADINDPRALRGTKGQRFPSAELAPAGFLDGRAVIVQPLTHHQEELGIAVFEYGSDGVVYELLRQAISLAIQGARLKHKVAQLALRDPLTGLFNRRHLDANLESEILRSQRYRRPLTAAIIDLDGFKQVNDRFGHDVGDRVLLRIVDSLREALRQSDLLARYGGDEFVVVAPETDREHADGVADRMLTAVRDCDCRIEMRVTASLGLATFNPGDETIDAGELLHRADQALLIAKTEGKACARHWGDIPKRDPARITDE